jgi:uncharacterized membrane protein
MSAWVGFVSVLLLGLVSGVSFSHLLQFGPKKTLPPVQFLTVQQVLFRNYGAAMGGLEVAALISTLAWAVIIWAKPVAPVLVSAASACVLAMVIIWAVWINPINKTVNSWRPESVPSNWADFRDRWHLLHAVRFILSVVAFNLVIAALGA